MWHVRGQPVSTQHVEGRVEVWGGEGARAELGCVAAVWGGEACFREYPGGWRGLWKGFGERRACSARASGYCAPCSAAVLPIDPFQHHPWPVHPGEPGPWNHPWKPPKEEGIGFIPA